MSHLRAFPEIDKLRSDNPFMLIEKQEQEGEGPCVEVLATVQGEGTLPISEYRQLCLGE